MAKTLPQKNLTYKPADAVLARFHASQKPVKIIRACRGSGKSTTALIDVYAEATRIPPQADGVRRSAWLITRTSYRDLEQSACKSYTERLVGTPGVLPLSGREPWNGGIRLDLPDGTTVESDWLFMAVADDDLGKLGSMQFTGAYCNELMDWSGPSIVNAVLASCGRYPSKDGFTPEYVATCEKAGKPLYSSRFIADTNGPYEGTWIHDAETKPPAGWEFFIQEPPLLVHTEAVEGAIESGGKYYTRNPKAAFARIQPKGYSYWEDLLGGAEDWFIESRILGQYSKTLQGKRVYGEFNEDMIVRRDVDLTAFRGSTLYIGVDTSGHHPAACLGFYKDAALHVVDEVCAQDVGFNSYVEDYLIPVLAGNYSEFEMVAICDPSNPQSALDKKTAMAVLLEAGLDARLASTNYFGDRVESVRKHLNRREGFYIYPAAETLLQGFRGAYAYKEVRGKPGVHQVTPDKTVLAADIHDALQYLCLGLAIDTGRRPSKPAKFAVRSRRAA